jgi:leucyl aminopeptidase
MQIAVSPASADTVGADAIAVAVAEPPGRLPRAAAGLVPLVETGEARTGRGEARLLIVDEVRLIAAGVGPRAAIDTDALRDAAGAAARELQATVGGTLAWLLDPGLDLPVGEQVRAVVEGVALGGYDAGIGKSHDRKDPIERLVLIGDEHVEDLAKDAEVVARWTNSARDLANRPPNDLTPARLAEHASQIATRFPRLTTNVLDPDELHRRGMGALLAVGAASHNGPRLIAMHYEPEAAARSDVVLGLVGKGITFDSGGISIKPQAYLEDMKGDMAGGGAVIAALGAIAELELPLRVLGVVAAAENLLDGAGFRPGDILTASNGTTIEIVNTDCEGRLALADALVYARGEGATHLLDLATLTGTMERALGDFYAGVFANDPGWRDDVVAAGESSGDHAWPWPLHPRYRRFNESAFADLKNDNIRRQGIPVFAAEFLREFAGDGPWAHVDIAGTAFLTWSRGDYLWQQGGTGYGVRLIVELARRLAGT